MKHITTSELYLNGIPVALIEFDSSEFEAEELKPEIEKRFLAMLTIKFEEKTIEKNQNQGNNMLFTPGRRKKKVSFDPGREFLQKAIKDFEKKGGKIHKIETPPWAYNEEPSYRSFRDPQLGNLIEC